MAEHGDEEHVVLVCEVNADTPTVVGSGRADKKPHGLDEGVVVGGRTPGLARSR
ncbi:hypothetical protein ACF064_27355 [Streptomyces sp. NPDC015492]|uniref:hypothetical protein n=1 Tax=Streptomyces sp. NPDC015492 TaxID=3364958 RepID=UPI0036FED222